MNPPIEKMTIDRSRDAFESIRTKLASQRTYHIHHHLFTCQNLQRDPIAEDFDRSYKPFDYGASPPVPASSVPEDESGEYATREIIEKRNWKTRVKYAKTQYERLPSKRKLLSIPPSRASAVVPAYLISFSKLLSKDPDPYLDSEFNWYFIGNGNLCSTVIDDDLYFIKSVNATIYIQKFQDAYADTTERSHVCINRQAIYETVSSTIRNRTVIGIRQKFRIYLLYLEKVEDKITLEVFKTVKSDVPFVGFVLDDISDRLFYSCADGSVNLMELNSEICAKIANIYEKGDAINLWSSINILDKSCSLVTNKYSIHILDERIDRIVKVNEYARMDCEYLTLSRFRNGCKKLVYSVNSHNILLFDLRYINEKKDLVKKWTHGLKNEPTLMGNIVLSDDELIYASGLDSSDGCFVQNCIDPNVQVSPWKPPFMGEHLRKLQLEGYYLDPMLDLRRRSESSRTGVILLPYDNKNYLFSLNSRGDVFSQIIHDDSLFVDKNPHDYFSEWCRHIYHEKKFVASFVVDMSPSRSIMKCKSKHFPIKRTKAKVLTTRKKSWKKCIEIFSKCSDMCAQELLNVWEVNVDDENADSELKPADTTFNKINDWLYKNV